VDGRVVLVDEDDHLLAVVAVEVRRQIPQGAPVQRLIALLAEDLEKPLLLLGAERLPVEQVPMVLVGPRDLLPDRRERQLEARRLDVLEGHRDDRVALEVLPRLRALLDGEAGEQGTHVLGGGMGGSPVVSRLLHEAAQRREVHGLAEATWSGEDKDLVAGDEHADDEIGLVDVVGARLSQVTEVGDADRDPGRTAFQGRERAGHRGVA
jgi:hypothetical protein